jgi:hypothetical protein
MTKKNNPTTWESPNKEPVAWALNSKIMVWAGGAIGILVTAVGVLVFAGFNAQERKMDAGYSALCTQLVKIEQTAAEEKRATNTILYRLVEDMAVVKTNQNARLERERIELGKGK